MKIFNNPITTAITKDTTIVTTTSYDKTNFYNLIIEFKDRNTLALVAGCFDITFVNLTDGKKIIDTNPSYMYNARLYAGTSFDVLFSNPRNNVILPNDIKNNIVPGHNVQYTIYVDFEETPEPVPEP